MSSEFNRSSLKTPFLSIHTIDINNVLIQTRGPFLSDTRRRKANAKKNFYFHK